MAHCHCHCHCSAHAHAHAHALSIGCDLRMSKRAGLVGSRRAERWAEHTPFAATCRFHAVAVCRWCYHSVAGMVHRKRQQRRRECGAVRPPWRQSAAYIISSTKQNAQSLPPRVGGPGCHVMSCRAEPETFSIECAATQKQGSYRPRPAHVVPAGHCIQMSTRFGARIQPRSSWKWDVSGQSNFRVASAEIGRCGLPHSTRPHRHQRMISPWCVCWTF
jgi:hypothetical protein